MPSGWRARPASDGTRAARSATRWRGPPAAAKLTGRLLGGDPVALAREDLARLHHGGEDLGVASATAQVAGERLGRLLGGDRAADLAQPGVGRHQDAGRAEAALRGDVAVEAV